MLDLEQDKNSMINCFDLMQEEQRRDRISIMFRGKNRIINTLSA